MYVFISGVATKISLDSFPVDRPVKEHTLLDSKSYSSTLNKRHSTGCELMSLHYPKVVSIAPFFRCKSTISLASSLLLPS